MLRISETISFPGTIILRLEGRIAGAWAAELELACEKVLLSRQPLSLDLSEVSFADRQGLQLIAGLIARGITLTACSPFLREQLKNVSQPPA